MAALTEDRDTKLFNLDQSHTNDAVVVAGTTVYRGSLVMHPSGANTIRPAADTAGGRIAGISDEQVSGSGTKRATYRYGVVGVFDHTPALDATVIGQNVFASDDQIVALKSDTTNDVRVGILRYYTTGSAHVEVGTFSQKDAGT